MMLTEYNGQALSQLLDRLSYVCCRRLTQVENPEYAKSCYLSTRLIVFC